MLATVGCCFTLFAEKHPIERYQTIIDRMPFGQPPPGFDPSRNPDEVSRSELENAAQELTQEQEAIQKAVQFSVINVEADGIVRVGFSDKSDPKSPRHFYMAVGEERGGWLVREADPAAKTMTVVKDGVEVELGLGDSTQGGDGGKGARGRLGGGDARARKSALLARSGASGQAAEEAGAARDVPEGRRARREREERERAELAARIEAENKRKAEEEAARREADQAAREAERAEQREQLMAIRDELRQAREESKKRRASESDGESDGESNGESESDDTNEEESQEDEE